MSERFTPNEIAFIQRCYIKRVAALDVAKALQRSDRNVRKYYGHLRDKGIRQQDENPGIRGMIGSDKP
jgi:hypothetical protein